MFGAELGLKKEEGCSARLGVIVLAIESAIVIAARIEALADLREDLNFIVCLLGVVNIFDLVMRFTFGIWGLCKI